MVEYRMRNVTRIGILCVAALSLMACQSIREAAGVTKDPPDEFAVATKAPLIMPPDYNLHPPKPGAPPLNQQSPTEAAQAAMYANADDPHAVAAAIPGDYSQVEKLFLAQSGAAGANHNIRREIAADNANTENTDKSFTDKLLFGGSDANPADKPVDADAEVAKRANGQAPAGSVDAPAKPTDSATIGGSSGGTSSDSSGHSWWPF
jgi:hypothetical protein